MDVRTAKETPSRSTYRATLAISIALGLGILLLVNYVGSRRYARFDWTATGRYSLSDKTVAVLKDLKTPVQVTVFMTPGTPLYPEVDELLKRYKVKSAMLTVETLDPTRNPARAWRPSFGILQFSDRREVFPWTQVGNDRAAVAVAASGDSVSRSSIRSPYMLSPSPTGVSSDTGSLISSSSSTTRSAV